MTFLAREIFGDISDKRAVFDEWGLELDPTGFGKSRISYEVLRIAWLM